MMTSAGRADPQPPDNPLVFRLNDGGQGPDLVRQVLLERGWQEYEETERDQYGWNLWWRSSRFRTCDYEHVMTWQKLNHFPKATAITKKDSLARNMKRMKAVYGGAIYSFSPIAFNLPNDYTRFVAEYSRLREKEQFYWICKPADLSRGRGITVFKDLSELQYDCNAVVQRYISNPLLISGYKFDLRIYVAVPSFHPLKIYVYREGLVRFGTEKYDLSRLHNLYSHLTNTSINKYSPSYTLDKERVGAGCKWTLTQLRHYFHQARVNDSLLWTRIINIVILTLIVQQPLVPRAQHCFELYGFDVIIDEQLKPWLLEVNFSPALSIDCQVDMAVKKPMLHDLMELLAFLPEDADRGVNGDVLSRNAVRGRRLPAIRTGSVWSNSSTERGPEEEEETRPIVPGCGLPSVQNYSKQMRPVSTRPPRRSHSMRQVNIGPSKIECRLHSDSGFSSQSCTSDGSDLSPEMGAGDDNGGCPVRKVHTQSDLQQKQQRGGGVKLSRSLSVNKSKHLNQRRDETARKSTSTPATQTFPPRPPNVLPASPSMGSLSLGCCLDDGKNSLSKAQKPLGPVQNFGDFQLVFPFNDVTRRSSRSDVDPRVITRECLKLLKERDEYTTLRKSAGDNMTSFKSRVSELTPVWIPKADVS